MAKSSHVGATINALIASSVAWDNLRPNAARSRNRGSVAVSGFPRLARFIACCERAAFGRSHPTPPMEAKNITEHARVWPYIVKLASATLAKSDSNGRLKFHF